MYIWLCPRCQAVIVLFSFGDGALLYAGTMLAGVFVLLLFAFPWRTISTVVQGLCLSVSLPVYFVFFALLLVRVYDAIFCCCAFTCVCGGLGRAKARCWHDGVIFAVLRWLQHNTVFIQQLSYRPIVVLLTIGFGCRSRCSLQWHGCVWFHIAVQHE